MYNDYDMNDYRQVPCQGQIYVIQAGDTIYRISRRYGVTVEAILAVNPGLDPDRLFIGQRICIPVQLTCPGGQIYVIQANDTLFAIAARFNTTVNAIIAANPGLDPNRLFIGQRICIPVAPATCPGGQLYTIRAGDTVFALAQRFQVSVNAILAANPGLNPNALRIGQQICIPGRPQLNCPSGNIYVIRPGDNLYSIAQRNGITLQALINANPQLTDPSNLTVGTNICIPAPVREE